MINEKIERDILFHLHKAWDTQNYQLFSQSLQRPAMQLIDHPNTLGQWDGRRRVISIQREFAFTVSWLEVVEVLKHEMAHQFVDEVLERPAENHGPLFQKVCADRGIQGAASAEVERDPRAQKLIDRIHKLLALAESDNQHEAERAAEQAQRLLTRHHISLQHERPSALSDLNQEMNFRQLGEAKKRYFQYEYELSHLLNDHFFVSCVWLSAFSVKTGRSGRVLQICGRPEDLEIASYVYDFVMNHLDLAWKSHRELTQAKGLQARLSFSLGLVNGFDEKLKSSQELTISERALVETSQARAEQFLRIRTPRMSSIGSSTWTPSSDYSEGFTQGHALNLHRGVHHTSTSTGAPRALTHQK